MKTVNGLTIEQYIDKEMKSYTTTFWGVKYRVKPVIHGTLFGDGLQLCYLGTINQRPHFWLIRIDSKIDISDDDFNYEEHLLCPLEEEFGRCPDFLVDRSEFLRMKKKTPRLVEEWENWKEYKRDCQYPHLDWEGGHWGMIANFGTGQESVGQNCL